MGAGNRRYRTIVGGHSVEAIKWMMGNEAAVHAFCAGGTQSRRIFDKARPDDLSSSRVEMTLHGAVVDPGDWLVRGVDGKLTKLSALDFARQHEVAP